jgi:hypothetical protein
VEEAEEVERIGWTNGRKIGQNLGIIELCSDSWGAGGGNEVVDECEGSGMIARVVMRKEGRNEIGDK